MKRYSDLKVLCNENNINYDYAKDEIKEYIKNEGSEEVSNEDDEPFMLFDIINNEDDTVYVGITSINKSKYYWIDE